MAQVLIRDLDDSIVESLKTIAANHGRSLQTELKPAMLNACRVITADRRLANSLKGSRYNQYVIKLSDLP